MKSFNKQKGFTITELLVILAVLAILLAVLLPKLYKNKNKKKPHISQVPAIKYPPLPTSSSATKSVEHGDFTDNVGSHTRSSTVQYKFHRYQYHYLDAVQTKHPVAGKFFRLYIEAADEFDSPKIEKLYYMGASVIINDQNAILITDDEGEIAFDIYIPSSEDNRSSTLYIILEEIPSFDPDDANAASAAAAALDGAAFRLKREVLIR